MVETLSAQLLPAAHSGGASPKGLEPGTELRARVEANLPDGVVRLATAEARIDLRVAAPLPVGSDVTVTVSGSKQQPAIQIITSNQAVPPGQTVPLGGLQTLDQARPTLSVSGQLLPATGAGAQVRPTPMLAQILQSGGALPNSAGPAPGTPVNTAQIFLQAPPVGSDSLGPGPVAASTGTQQGTSAGVPSSAQTSTQTRALPGTPAGLPGAGNAGSPRASQASTAGTTVRPASLPGTVPASSPGNTLSPQIQPQQIRPPQGSSGSAFQTASVPGAGVGAGALAGTGSGLGSGGTVPSGPEPNAAPALPVGRASPTGTPPSQPGAVLPTAGGPVQQAGFPNTGQTQTTAGKPPISDAPASNPQVTGGSELPKAGGASGVNSATNWPPNTATAPTPWVMQNAPPASSPGITAATSRAETPSPPTSGSSGGTQITAAQPAPFSPQTTQIRSSLSSNVLQSSGNTTNLYPARVGIGTPQASSGNARSSPVPNSPLQQAANVLRQPLAEQQAGLGALFAQIGSLTSAQEVGKISLPDPIQKAMQQILGLRLGGGQMGGNQAGTQAGKPVSVQSGGTIGNLGTLAQNVRQAVQQSGQFREAFQGRSSGDSGPTTDLKSTLISFKTLLQRFGAEAHIVKPAQQPAIPTKRGAPQGQAPQAAGGAETGAISKPLQSLLQNTDGVLARMRLTQLVNSGLAGDDGPQTPASRPVDVVLELPLALGLETAVMQMQVGRDGGGVDGQEDDEPAWRLRFALDLTATGPLEAAVSLRGGGTYVSLWVDRKDTLDALSEVRETMESAFADAGLDLQELRLIRGLPPKTAVRYGALIDRQS